MEDKQRIGYLEDKVKGLQENIAMLSDWLIELRKLMTNLELFDDSPYSKETISVLIAAIDAYPRSTVVQNMMVEQDHFNDSDLNRALWLLTELSHELRTPLSTIQIMSEILNSSIDNSKQHKYIQIMSRNCEIMMKLIETVPGYPKIPSSTLDSKSIKTNIGDLFQFSIDSFQLRSKNSLLNFSCFLGFKEQHALVDPTLLSQVILNLLSNAEKFTLQGEVVLKSEIIYDSGTELTFQTSVEDSGIGIKKSRLTTVFDAFVQGETTSEETNIGSGLGLYISKKIISKMGGEIWAKSDLGLGTKVCFTLTLPKIQ